MKDVIDIINNISGIYESDMSFTVLKDFERVLDDLDIYVYENWAEGELVSGPNITRHWVSCQFMWDLNKMPDPMGGKRLLDYDCKVTYKKDSLIKPRRIRKPDDVRPGTKKGKLDVYPIWIVEIMMPKKLIADIYGGYKAMNDFTVDPATQPSVPAEQQSAEGAADATAEAGDPTLSDVETT